MTGWEKIKILFTITFTNYFDTSEISWMHLNHPCIHSTNFLHLLVFFVLVWVFCLVGFFWLFVFGVVFVCFGQCNLWMKSPHAVQIIINSIFPPVKTNDTCTVCRHSEESPALETTEISIGWLLFKCYWKKHLKFNYFLQLPLYPHSLQRYTKLFWVEFCGLGFFSSKNLPAKAFEAPNI